MKHSRYAFLFPILLVAILLAAISTLAYAQETTRLCVDFQDWAEREGVEVIFAKDGFMFTFPDNYPMSVEQISWDPVLYGLHLAYEIQIDFPQAASQVTIRALLSEPLRITAYNRENDVADISITSSITETIHTISLSGVDMVRLLIGYSTDDAYLADICIEVEEVDAEGTGVNLIAPEDGATDVAVTDIAFRWSEAASADEYDWVLSTNAELSSPIATEEGLTSTITAYTGTALDYETPYYWHVTALKEGGVISTSTIGTFTTVAQEEEPKPPDMLVPILGGVAVALAGTLATRKVMKSRRHQKWQNEAEENLQEPCEPGTKCCQKIEGKYELSQCRIKYLRLTAYNAVSGKLSEEKQVRGKIADGLNMVIAASRQGEQPEKLKKQIIPLAQALLRSIMDWLYEKRGLQNVSITGHLEGCKVTYKFKLKECKETHTWGEAKEEWEVTIKEERDEPLSVLQRLESSIGISEQLTAELTLRLMQFIEKV